MEIRKHPEARCESCPLQFSGEYVPSKGPNTATIGIVGEAPGYYEVAKGEPFVGASGKVLNAVLNHHGIGREKLFITNAVACRHPNGDNPGKEEISGCRPRVLSELRERGVTKVLAVGNVANESLLNEVGVNALRIGPGKKSPYDSNLRIVSSLHPAYVLRAPDTINLFTTDVGKLITSPPEWAAPAFIVVDEESTALQALDELWNMKPEKMAVDIETHIEKDAEFGQPNQLGLLCVGVAYTHNKVVVFGEEVMDNKDVMRYLAKVLNACGNITMHNGKFDMKGLFPKCGHIYLNSDTMLMSYSLSEYSGIHKPHSLEFIGRELIGAPDWKHVLDKYNPRKNGYGVIPRRVLYQYNAYDCAITFDVETVLRERMEKIDVTRVHDFLVEVSNEIIYMEMNGIGIDRAHMDTLSKDFGEQLTVIINELEDLLPRITPNYLPPAQQKKSDRIYNPGSPKQTKEVLSDFGVTVASTDEKHLSFIIEKRPDSEVARFCRKLLEYRGIAKEKGTYVDGIDKRLYAGRIYTNFLLHGTTNGRLSSRNPNLQNIPRRNIIRKLFVPVKPEHILIQTDYSQAELRVISWLSGDRYFTPIFNEGLRDVFDELTTDLFPSLDKATTSKAQWKEIRSKRVKPFVYGLAYGRTEYGLAAERELNLTVSEAKTIMNRFLKLIPEIVQWQDSVKSEVENGNDLVSTFGRRRRFPLITDDNHDDVMREALSFLPSSISSDICLRAMCRVRRELKGIGWVRNIVHDSILVECHQNRIDEVTSIMEGHMLDSAKELTTSIKFAVETEVGSSWGELSAKV